MRLGRSRLLQPRKASAPLAPLGQHLRQGRDRVLVIVMKESDVARLEAAGMDPAQKRFTAVSKVVAVCLAPVDQTIAPAFHPHERRSVDAAARRTDESGIDSRQVLDELAATAELLP